MAGAIGFYNVSAIANRSLYQVSEVNSSLDNYTKCGIYGVNRSMFDVGIISYGLLVVFSANTAYTSAGGGYPVVQLLINTTSPQSIKIRSCWSGTWNDWRTI